MAKYAKNTSVSVSKSKSDINKILVGYGIDEYFMGSSPRGEGVGFKYEGRVYKHNVPMPKKEDYRLTSQYEQAVRQRWRIFYMSLKMKLEEVHDGGISFEDQFLSMMALPDGSTVGDFMKLPENLSLIQKTEMPKLLTG